MDNFKRSRVLYKMAWEISNMLKSDSTEFSKIESLLNKIIVSNNNLSLSERLNNLYKIINSKKIGVKQRRGIAYKLDIVIRENENFPKMGFPITWEEINKERNEK